MMLSRTFELGLVDQDSPESWHLMSMQAFLPVAFAAKFECFRGSFYRCSGLVMRTGTDICDSKSSINTLRNHAPISPCLGLKVKAAVIILLLLRTVLKLDRGEEN